MRKIADKFMKTFSIMNVLSVLMTIFATMFGGSAMAVEVGEYGSDTDPNEGTALEGAVKTVPEEKGGIVQHGKDASGSALQDAGLVENQINRTVLEYHSDAYPFYTNLMTKAIQQSVKGHKEAEYPEIGDVILEALTKTAISNSTAKDEEVALPVYKNDATIFQPNFTIVVDSMEGYDEAGNHDGSPLMLYVTSNVGGKAPMVRAINGPINNSTKETYVPDIPAGTRITCAAPALAEDEVEVRPNNSMPTMAKAYLQKKAYAVETTDFFREVKKKAEWGLNQIKKQALDTYKRQYTTSMLFSAQRKWYKTTEKGATRICYSQKGVLQQLKMGYQLTSNVTYEDLIAISKMLFTKFTNTRTLDVYCGSDFIEGLLNLDFGKRNPIVYANDADLKADVATFKSTFGTLRFHHELSLTENHLEAAAIAVPMEDCVHLYRENGLRLHLDGKKGQTGGVVTESETDYFIQDDCIVINSMASMLIGPAAVFNTKNTAGITTQFKSVAELASSATKGDKVYLTVADATHPIGAYEWTGSKWEKWSGLAAV